MEGAARWPYGLASRQSKEYPLGQGLTCWRISEVRRTLLLVELEGRL